MMALSIEDILLGTDNELASPERAAALAGALKNERRYGVLGQLMNLEPTRAAGQQLVGRADDALKLGVSRQEAGLKRSVEAENLKLERESNALRRATEERRHNEMLGLRTRAADASESTAASMAADRDSRRIDREEAARKPLEAGISSGNQILGSIAALRKHPGLRGAVGVTGFARRRVPRSPEFDFATIEGQLQGQNFMTAFQSLKGGGPITDTEGEKATNAMSRIRTAQSPEQYLQALTELETLVRDTMARQAAEADRRGLEGLPVPAAPTSEPETVPAAGGETRVINGVRYVKRDGQWFQE